MFLDGSSLNYKCKFFDPFFSQSQRHSSQYIFVQKISSSSLLMEISLVLAAKQLICKEHLVWELTMWII